MRHLLLALVIVGCSGGSSASGPAPGATTGGNEQGTTPAAQPTGPIVAHTSPVCGSRGSAPCSAGTFCDFPPGSQCGATDAGGQCASIPSACTREYRPVCGCDGQTYPTECVAHSSSISVAHDGPC